MKYKFNNTIYNTRKEVRKVSKSYERIPENSNDKISISKTGNIKK